MKVIPVLILPVFFFLSCKKNDVEVIVLKNNLSPKRDLIQSTPTQNKADLKKSKLPSSPLICPLFENIPKKDLVKLGLSVDPIKK